MQTSVKSNVDGNEYIDLNEYASALFNQIVAEKLRFLDYLIEVDMDPTLHKVVYHITHSVIRELASNLSILGLSEAAESFFREREENIDIPAMLPLLDRIARIVTAHYPTANFEPPQDIKYNTLAEIRAGLIAMARVDNQDEFSIKNDEVLLLMQNEPIILDQRYMETAKFNPILLPMRNIDSEPRKIAPFENMKASENTETQSAEAIPQAPPNDLITTEIAVKEYHTSRSTIRRKIEDGLLKDWREPSAPNNAKLQLSRAELDRLFSKRK